MPWPAQNSLNELIYQTQKHNKQKDFQTKFALYQEQQEEVLLD